MKIIFTPIITVAAMIMIIMAPALPVSAQSTDNCSNPVTINSWKGCEPIVSTAGVVSTDKYSAVVQAFYSSNGATYISTDNPVLSIEYRLVPNGNFFMSPNGEKQNIGSRTQSFLIEGLTEGKQYEYRAVLRWVGGIKYGDPQRFTATKAITTSTNTTTSSETTTSTTTNTTVVPAPANSTPSIFGGLFGTKKTTTPELPKNVDEKSGFRLTIDDEETQVRQGDEVIIKARYENNNTKSYQNAEIKVYLAPQYTFANTNKGIYDRVDNTVTVSLNEFPAGGFGTVTVIANATAKSGNLDQAISQATLKVAGITLKATDIDEYAEGKGGSGSVLGGSASGVGFLPGSLWGWVILLIVLALIIIIGRRYFIKKDY